MKYPQSLFTKKIKELLPVDVNTIIDAPCGNGSTTNELAQYFPYTLLIGVDINKENIAAAKRNYSSSKVIFQQADIHDFVEKSETFKVFCLINSLFLLPKPKKLLQKITSKFTQNGQLILILPNPESTNFKHYQSLFPEVNSFILQRIEYETFFKNLGLTILSCEGIARVPFYGRWDTKLLYPIRDRYLFWLEKRSKSKDYAYFLIALKKIKS